MDLRVYELLQSEELGITIGHYWTNTWVHKGHKYYKSIPVELVDNDPRGMIEFSNPYFQMQVSKQREKDQEDILASDKKVYVERIDSSINDFLKSKPKLSQTYYFGNVVSVQLFKIQTRSGLMQHNNVATQESYRDYFRNIVGEEFAKKADEMVEPIYSDLVKKLNDTYKRLFGDTPDEAIPLKVYTTIGSFVLEEMMNDFPN